MTIKQIISTYHKKLKSSSPILDIELLLTKTLKKEREYLCTYPEKKLTDKQLHNFKTLFKRRQNGEPMAYILGYKYFYGLKFKVNKSVLIPRPETEILVEEVIKYYQALSPKLKAQSIFLDIGVGSGTIIITLAKTICRPEHSRRANKCKYPQFYGVDISAKALSVAKQNAQSHGIFCHGEPSRTINKKPFIKFLKGNLLSPLQSVICNLQSDLIITANLPYLDQKEKTLLPSSETRGLKFEPQISLYGGDDGLKYYREFFNQIKQYKLKPQAIFLEIGHNQAGKIKKLAKETLPGYKLKVKKDLCGFDRFIIITK